MMFLDVRISPADGRPIYRQLVEQVERLIATGRLTPGDRLPPVRRLAEQLAINPNTVARAYRQLESAGSVISRPGSGVFVNRPGSPLSADEKTRLLNERIDLLLTAARQLGIGDRTLTAMITERRRQLAAPGPRAARGTGA